MTKIKDSPPPAAPGPTFVTAMTVGSASKTTLARHVLLAHMDGARLLSVESATPSGQEADLYQRGQDQVREALRFELFAAAPGGKIIDCGVTDSELVAEVVAEIATIGRAQHITVVLPVLVEAKGLKGLESFGAKLPAQVRKVAVLTQVADAAAAARFRDSKVGKAVETYCAEHQIALCPIPFLKNDLLDSDTRVHEVAMDGRTLADVANLDLDKLAIDTQNGQNRAAAAQLGLLIGAAALAPSALENTRAIYDWIARQE
jgi:hypothetical protein